MHTHSPSTHTLHCASSNPEREAGGGLRLVPNEAIRPRPYTEFWPKYSAPRRLASSRMELLNLDQSTWRSRVTFAASLGFLFFCFLLFNNFLDKGEPEGEFRLKIQLASRRLVGHVSQLKLQLFGASLQHHLSPRLTRSSLLSSLHTLLPIPVTIWHFSSALRFSCHVHADRNFSSP